MSRPGKKSRRQPQQRAPQPEPQVVPAEVQPAWGDVPEPVLVLHQDVNQLHGHEVDERQLQLLVKDWRRGRATRNIWQALGDAYVALFSFAVIAAMLISSIARAQALAAECSTEGCTTARGLLPWAMLAGVLGLTLAAARVFGPVLASAAEGFWLMDAPLQRSKMLARRLWAIIVAALVIGALVGALTAALTGGSLMAVGAWALGTGLAAAGITAFAAAEQGAERIWLVRILQAVISLVGLVVLLAVVATASGWISLTVTDALAVELGFAVAGVGLLLCIGAGLIARARLSQIRRARLQSGGSLVAGMQGAMFAMDFGLMRDILVEREAVARGHVRPTRGRSTGLASLIWRDVQRLFRYPRPLVLYFASMVVPYAVQALGLGRLTVPISALVLMAALVPFFTTLRVLSRTRGLARTFPFSTSQLRTAASAVPAILAGIWGVAVTAAFVGVGGSSMLGNSPAQAAMWALITAFAGFLAGIRWVSAKSANYNTPMVATSMGAMPPGLMFNLIRGFDMVALMSLPAIVGWSPWISVVLGVIIFSFLRMGGIDQEELKAMQEENKRQAAEARASIRGEAPAKSTEKIKVTRTKREGTRR
ncbi:DUF6297 family protein [Aestuariimicrobium ganziense]|uniref:DUF6297 family protein n=1 Tax=Aestuariimicrobium ganziense TaxID=2773677 RepID=UPI00194306C3|nr:DUF6297 family protein [Aestuariimicrobium ganziense]